MEQMTAVLDNAPVAVSVSAVSDKRLLYANRLARELFWNGEMPGQASDTLFCQEEQMSREKFLVSEFRDERTGRYYRRSRRIVDWAEIPAQIEYIADITEERKKELQSQELERELTLASEKMQDIINAIPGGVAIYKVSDIFETVYFSNGVPELSGYTVEEYQGLIEKDAAEMTYWEDTAFVVRKAREVIESHEVSTIEFRKQHRDGRIVWVRAQIKWIGEEDGCPLLHCVFHNISDLKEAELEKDHLLNSIPGGIASYQVEEGRFIPLFYSDGVMALSGHTRKEYEQMLNGDALNLIYPQDRERVQAAAQAALISGEVLDVSYRMRHKDGKLIWIHLNGRRMGPLSDRMRFYAVFTGMSAETRLFQNIANETADGIYVIGRDNYDLLYVNESKELFCRGKECVGQKCYAALMGKQEPCEFCSLKTHAADGVEHEMVVPGSDRYYYTRFLETVWNGLPATVKFVRDVTEEVQTRQEKERLEQYFRTVLQNLPGGVAVVRCGKDGTLTPEYLSDGFAAMTGVSLKEAWEMYREDAMAGVHPEDQDEVLRRLKQYITGNDSHCEIQYRLQTANGGYVWVKSTLSMIQSKGGESIVYAVYQDITREREEQNRLQQQYRELLISHYHTEDPNALILGHCNISKNHVQEIIAHTDFDLLQSLGSDRNGFFTHFGEWIVDEGERQEFYGRYLNEPALRAYERGETEQKMDCFVRLPKESIGRYVRIVMNLVATPGSGDITGILTVMDITKASIAEKILHRILATGYDFVADVDLLRDQYEILIHNKDDNYLPPVQGCYTQWMEQTMGSRVAPGDRERFWTGLNKEQILKRLEQCNSYNVGFSLADDSGEIRTKNVTITAVDLRLGRVCFARTDITESVREQQGLLHVIAYTFEVAGFINMGNGSFTLYERQTVLDNLPPFYMENYDEAVRRFVERFGAAEGQEEAREQFRLETILKHLQEKPDGYDFLFHYRNGEERYKQINVMWGDVNHRTICMVRADVTDTLMAERQTKKALENALMLAEEANRAKSDFLSAMSHDIRTPMNAVMGMTALAVAHLDDRDKVADCLQKISTSSRHLLSLINDVLDMSKIEYSQISLNRIRIRLPELVNQLTAMIGPQARAAGLHFVSAMENVEHECFYGDPLRLNQVLINILSNAVKYTPEGGQVEFLVEEMEVGVRTADDMANGVAGEDGPADNLPCRIRYRFTVSDTGIGMSKEFLAHVFEPFTRNKRVERVEGTGLGLSITKGLVELMGGAIFVESQPGIGSTFRVELEFEEAGNSKEIIRKDAPSSLGGWEQKMEFTGCRFLVAEDNTINAEILCEFLSMCGAQTVVAIDGEKAVEAFSSAEPGTYDGILMDIQMPKVNGYEATRKIRRLDRPDAGVIPIVAMTANAFAEDVKAALESGMNAHVAKPIDMEVLCVTLRQVLKRAETDE